MKKLIVNADDFGLTLGVSQAIIEGHQRGIITSTSLLANGRAFDPAVAMCRQAPRLGVGVHLNLTQGTPVLPPASVPSLVRGGGLLSGSPGSLWRGIVRGKIRLTDVEKELGAQIAKVRAAGVAPTHLDGHKHVHLLPGISRIVIRLAQEYGIKAVRCTLERKAGLLRLLRRQKGSARRIFKQYLSSRALFWLSWHLKRRLRQGGLVFAGYFYGLTQTGFLDAEALRDIILDLPEGSSELMCHPGYLDEELRKIPTRLREERENELRALMQPALRELVMDRGIQLVSYRDIVRGATQTAGPRGEIEID
jgi:hopanoid biosynthesis associated protein HpnK